MVEVGETLKVDSLIAHLTKLQADTGASDVVVKYGSLSANHVMQVREIEVDEAGRVVIVVE
jgi:hypothetical protein